MKRILLIGGGAAGIAAALTAKHHAPEAEVLLLERLDRVGKKILATGNGRCNLTNMQAGMPHFHSSDRGALKAVLQGMEPQVVLDFFRAMGLLCQEEEEGRVYPYCKQASMVLDVLLQALERANIRVCCNTTVTAIGQNRGKFTVKTADGGSLTADRVILPCGGKAAPKLGSDGSGYALAKALGHSCTPLVPALVALKCDMNGMGGLKGIRAAGELTLLANDHVLGQEAGELQFTEYGLSGIPVMQLSGRLSRLRKGEKCTALVDLFPEWEEEALFRELKSRQKMAKRETLETFLLGTVHKRLAYAVLKSAGLQPLSRPVTDLSNGDLHRLAETLKCWRFAVTGTQGWDAAQVTGGGIPLSEIDGRAMESKRAPGLHLAGEILDVTGDCGGFNLHWAWGSGIRAGQAAAKAVQA